MNHNKITITGDLGSGKSTVARELCKRLGYEYLSTGNIQREMAARLGLDTLEMNYRAKTDKEIDRLIDERLMQINDENKSYVLDSRLAWHFVKNSFKVYLTVQPEIAAQRVMEDTKRRNEPLSDNVNAKSQNLLERRRAEDDRFKKTYGIDCGNLNNYDMIVDTSELTVDEVVTIIIDIFGKWRSGRSYEKFANKKK